MHHRPAALLAIYAVALCITAMPSWAAETGAGAPGPDPLFEPPDAEWLRHISPGTQSLKVYYEGPAGERILGIWMQVDAARWSLGQLGKLSEPGASCVMFGGPPTGRPEDLPLLVLADWYRVPMPSAVGCVYLWPCVPGARYCVWVGKRRFSGTVGLNPRGRDWTATGD